MSVFRYTYGYMSLYHGQKVSSGQEYVSINFYPYHCSVETFIADTHFSERLTNFAIKLASCLFRIMQLEIFLFVLKLNSDYLMDGS